MARPREPLAGRFWAKVQMIPFHPCWEWAGSQGNGYGQIGAGGGEAGSIGAHRASWLIHHGPIPDGVFVLHRCDNKTCVNPDHLFLGTPGDNMRDKVAKGRHNSPRGERHWRTRRRMEDQCLSL